MATKKKTPTPTDGPKIKCRLHRQCRLKLDGVEYEPGAEVEVTQEQLDGWRAIMSQAQD
jgi:hypothetical protein